jgi:hypothetical protein
MMDKIGNKDMQTRQMLSLVKAHVPITMQTVADRCIQAHGAMGLSQDTMLFAAFAGARWLRLADGPDEVHWRTAARIELGKQKFSPFEEIPYYNEYPDHDKDKVWRRSTDKVSPEAQKQIDLVSGL